MFCLDVANCYYREERIFCIYKTEFLKHENVKKYIINIELYVKFLCKRKKIINIKFIYVTLTDQTCKNMIN